MRGDEPGSVVFSDLARYVFPTCVGMNPGRGLYADRDNGVPHMRGDEPLFFLFGLPVSRVPHMRGDEPIYEHMRELYAKCSPHAWG